MAKGYEKLSNRLNQYRSEQKRKDTFLRAHKKMVQETVVSLEEIGFETFERGDSVINIWSRHYAIAWGMLDLRMGLLSEIRKAYVPSKEYIDSLSSEKASQLHENLMKALHKNKFNFFYFFDESVLPSKYD